MTAKRIPQWTTAIATMTAIVLTENVTWGDCPLAHTHIGKNPTWQPADWNNPGGAFLDDNPNDDSKLWFFSLPPTHPLAPTPGWPNWSLENGDPFLLTAPASDPLGNPIYKPADTSRQLYTVEFMYGPDGYGDPNGVQHLDGWHSAHGPQGAWNLSSVEGEEPIWDLILKREGTSLAEDDFFMSLPNGTAVLTGDGDEYGLTTQWLDDKSAWGLHEHMSFGFWLPTDGSAMDETLLVTMSVYDTGGLYQAADPYTMTFKVVPEPASWLLLGVGVVAMGYRRRPS